jgi:hypothetical protein
VGPLRTGRSRNPSARIEFKGFSADESLYARTIFGLDAHGGIDAEATGALPGKHVGGVTLVE